MSVLNRNSSRSLGEREMLCEQEPQTSVSTAFSQVFPNFHECFNNSIETPRTCFLNTAMKKKRKTACLLLLSKFKLSLLAPSLCPQLMLVLCFSQVMETYWLFSKLLLFNVAEDIYKLTSIFCFIL